MLETTPHRAPLPPKLKEKALTDVHTPSQYVQSPFMPSQMPIKVPKEACKWRKGTTNLHLAIEAFATQCHGT